MSEKISLDSSGLNNKKNVSNYVCISFIQAFALPFPWIYNSHSRRLCIYHPP